MIIYQIHLSEHYSNLTILLLARIASNNMSEESVVNLAIDLRTNIVDKYYLMVLFVFLFHPASLYFSTDAADIAEQN